MNLRLIVALLAGVTACGAFSSDSTEATGAGTGPMDAGAGSTDAGTDADAPLTVQGPATDLASGQQTPADIVTDAANVLAESVFGRAARLHHEARQEHWTNHGDGRIRVARK